MFTKIDFLINTFKTAIDVTEKTDLDKKITKAIIKTQKDKPYEIGSELQGHRFYSAQTGCNCLKRRTLICSP